MKHTQGQSDFGVLGLDFDRRLEQEIHGSKGKWAGGLLTYREFDDAMDLAETAGPFLAGTRTRQNGCHELTGRLGQSTFRRFTRYKNVNNGASLE